MRLSVRWPCRAPIIDRIEIRWIGGGVDVLENVPVDRLITITEGKGETGE